jgi:hypothetical protein
MTESLLKNSEKMRCKGRLKLRTSNSSRDLLRKIKTIHNNNNSPSSSSRIKVRDLQVTNPRTNLKVTDLPVTCLQVTCPQVECPQVVDLQATCLQVECPQVECPQAVDLQVKCLLPTQTPAIFSETLSRNEHLRCIEPLNTKIYF